MTSDIQPEPDPVVIDHEHEDLTGGWLRPSVFGAMDGLVSNAALVAGVAGGTRHIEDTTAVILAGIAGLAAGAFSMAVGEYVSVASESESAQREVDKERAEILAHPEEERAELVEILVDKGLAQSTAEDVARQVHQDVETAVTVHAQIEFGVDPDGLASPKVAAVSSFLAFTAGASVPVVPYLFGAETLTISIVVTLMVLFALGAVVTRVTSRPWWYGGGRQVLLGCIAFAATYGIGMLVGASV
ncbi:VIT1/CCC1 transporter family protein [Nocardioides limicola]|uniref:VIT1/CCC1 transporter family protein n=1 Tax=Nocardioides limicola TaxID=2803368 RepID=UPI0027DC2389|nr:VIT1/CCC1 transporter family protein [Nocardioides sp. DJM-14]